ncbi:hypothetical protein BDR26DRAFT_879887 [Obelidium mucronatum]|nr:hypothetical protein BDR26DRAFT_879887 [Obelidium mucronatum]
MEDPFGSLDLDDDLFEDSTPVAPRKVMPASYPYPLAEDGLFFPIEGQDLLSPLNFAATFHSSKLAPTNISSVIERMYLLKQFEQCLALTRLWIVENRKQAKPFGNLEICDISARCCLKVEGPEAALAALEDCEDLDLTHPTQTTAGSFMFYTQLLRQSGGEDNWTRALDTLTMYFSVRGKDYRGFIEVYEVLIASMGSVEGKLGADGAKDLRLIASLAMRRAKWLFSQSLQPYLMDTPLMKRRESHENTKIDSVLDSNRTFLDAFDASVEDEDVFKNGIMDSLLWAFPKLKDQTVNWIRADILIKSSAANLILGDDEGDDEDASVSKM